MSFSKFFVIGACAIFSLSISAQKSSKPFTGVLEFSIEYEGNWDPVALSTAPRFFTINVGENHTRTTFNTQGVVFETIMNTLDSTMTILINAMGERMYAKIPKLVILEKLDERSKPKIEYTSESMNIAGFTAQKAIYTVTDEFGEETQYEVWFTRQIGKPSMNFGQQFHGLDGFPVQYTIQTEQGKVIYQLKSAKPKKFKTLDFLVPTDYKEVDYKQFQEMLGM